MKKQPSAEEILKVNREIAHEFSDLTNSEIIYALAQIRKNQQKQIDALVDERFKLLERVLELEDEIDLDEGESDEEEDEVSGIIIVIN